MSRLLSLKKLTDIVEGVLHAGPGEASQPSIVGISTDSRHIKPGELFIAISGEHFDGHDFVINALEQDAAGALVSGKWYVEHGKRMPEHGAVVSVPDVLNALQMLAGWHRMQFDVRVVAVTGSNGKTTTKDMITAILETQHHLLKTPGNLNSQIGTPQVLLSLNASHDLAVLELGMNHAGEISRLAKMVRPSVAVITNVGPAHLENLKTLEGVGRAKGELLDFLSPDGWAVLNADDPYVMAQRGRTKARILTFGTGIGSDIKLENSTSSITGSTFELNDGSSYHLRIPGEHQVKNAMAAIAVARLLGIADDTVKSVLSALQPSAMRMCYLNLGDIQILNDTYNANPTSTVSALSTLSMTSKRKVAILGDMLELGEISGSAHRKVGQTAAHSCDILITVGEYSKNMTDGAIATGMNISDIFQCEDTSTAAEMAMSLIKTGDVILVKGSRGMKMEIIVEAITAFVKAEGYSACTT